MEEKHHPFSPSVLRRRASCPGSYLMESAIADVEPSEAAQRGTRIHAYVAAIISGEKPDIALDDQEQTLAERILAFWTEFKTTHAIDKVYTEHRVHAHNWGKELYYGSADVVCINGKEGTVIDWKTGFNFVDDADINWQGIAYATAVQQMYNLDSVEVIFYNPSNYQDTRKIFSRKHLADMFIHFVEIINRGKTCADRMLCVDCKYCKAAITGTCPEWKAQQECTVALAQSEAKVPYTQMPDDTLAMLFDRCKIVATMESSIEAELKKRIEANGSCGGYTIKETSGGREAKNIVELWAAIEDVISQPDFLNCCSASVSKIETLFAKAQKANGTFATEKEGKAEFKNRTATVITEKAARKSIVKESK